MAPAAAGDPAIAARVLDAVIALVPVLRERAVATEALGRVLDESVRDLDAAGAFKMAIPVEYGGYALTPLQQFDIVCEISRGCASTGWMVWVTTTAQQWLGLMNEQFQDEIFKPDWVGPLNSGVTSDIGPGKARRVEGGYMLKGRWPFNSGGHHTMFHHLGAVLEDAPAMSGPSMLMVPRDQVTILDDWKVLGMKGSGSNTAVIEEEVFVPEHRGRPFIEMIMSMPQGPQRDGVLYRMNLGLHTASAQAAIAVGMARAAVELFQAHIRTRGITATQYKKQSEAPVTHLQLGELHCKLQVVELLARSNVARVEAMAAAGAPFSMTEMQRAKLETSYASVVAAEICALAFRAAGATAIRQGGAFERLMRDSNVLTMHAMNQIESCKEDYGRSLAEAG